MQKTNRRSSSDNNHGATREGGPDMDGSQDHWTVDKRLPIGLIATMVAQTVAVGVWLGSVQARLNYVENNQSARTEDSSRLAVVESQLKTVNVTLNSLDDKITSFLGDKQ